MTKPLKYDGVTNRLYLFRQYLLGRHMTIRAGQIALSWLRRTTETMPQLAGTGRKHGNAEGVRRRPATNEDNDDRVSQESEIRVNEGHNVEQEIEDTEDAHGRRFLLQKIRFVKKEVDTKVREFPQEGSAISNEGDSLQERQRTDEDLASNRVPEYEDLSSEVTKNREFLSQRVEDVLRQYRDGVIEICRPLDVAKLFHRTMNAILAKTIDEHQRDWDSQLPFAMAAYRVSRYEGTDYSLNFLVLGYEVQVPMYLK